MIRERLRRGLLVALEDVGDGPRDERDWQALTEENETLRERNGELEEEHDAHEAELEELKAKHEVEISTLRAEVAHLDHLRESEKDARAEAKRTYEEVVKLRKLHHCEPDSMRGALMSIVEACNRHLPRELFNDYKSPLISAAREIRNLATRGLQNDPVFMRDEKARQEAEKPIELDEGPRVWVEVEVNGKTYGSVNLSRQASIEAARAAFDEKFGHVLGTKRVVKFVYVPGKIISVGASPWNLTVQPEAGSCVPGSDPGEECGAIDPDRPNLSCSRKRGHDGHHEKATFDGLYLWTTAPTIVGVDTAVGRDCTVSLLVERAPNNAIRILREERERDHGPVEFEPEDSDENRGH